MAVSGETVSRRLEDRCLGQNSETQFVACGGGWRSAIEVQDRVMAVASGLFDLGIRRGDRVATMMPNRDEAVDIFFACAELGAIQIPLNIYLKGEFLGHQLRDAEPTVVIADDSGLRLVRSALSSELLRKIKFISVDDGDGSTDPFSTLLIKPERKWPRATPDDLVCVLYTSGTTGMPKGCMISNGYLVHMPQGHLLHDWFRLGDVSFCPLPLYHGAAINLLMDALVLNGSAAFDPAFSASRVIERARQIGATQFFGVGSMAAAMLATSPSPRDRDHSIERADFYPLLPHLQEPFAERFGVRVLFEGYGQTEVIPATMNGSLYPRKTTGGGYRLPWLDVEVVDENDCVLGVGERGEIVVRPREPYSMFSGYWRNEKATLEAWRNLWHHTGDLGYFDEDGSLHFLDRKKDALRRRGENVSSMEVEQALLRHPDVVEAAVHSVPSRLGEDEVKACLILRPGAEVTMEEWFDFFKQNLPYFAVPRYLEIRDSFPTNVIGKVQKNELRAAWDTEETVDFDALGLAISLKERR